MHGKAGGRERQFQISVQSLTEHVRGDTVSNLPSPGAIAAPLISRLSAFLLICPDEQRRSFPFHRRLDRHYRDCSHNFRPASLHPEVLVNPLFTRPSSLQPDINPIDGDGRVDPGMAHRIHKMTGLAQMIGRLAEQRTRRQLFAEDGNGPCLESRGQVLRYPLDYPASRLYYQLIDAIDERHD